MDMMQSLFSIQLPSVTQQLNKFFEELHTWEDYCFYVPTNHEFDLKCKEFNNSLQKIQEYYFPTLFRFCTLNEFNFMKSTIENKVLTLDTLYEYKDNKNLLYQAVNYLKHTQLQQVYENKFVDNKLNYDKVLFTENNPDEYRAIWDGWDYFFTLQKLEPLEKILQNLYVEELFLVKRDLNSDKTYSVKITFDFFIRHPNLTCGLNEVERFIKECNEVFILERLKRIVLNKSEEQKIKLGVDVYQLIKRFREYLNTQENFTYEYSDVLIGNLFITFLGEEFFNVK